MVLLIWVLFVFFACSFGYYITYDLFGLRGVRPSWFRWPYVMVLGLIVFDLSFGAIEYDLGAWVNLLLCYPWVPGRCQDANLVSLPISHVFFFLGGFSGLCFCMWEGCVAKH